MNREKISNDDNRKIMFQSHNNCVTASVSAAKLVFTAVVIKNVVYTSIEKSFNILKVILPWS